MRQARTIVTRCNGLGRYGLHLCLQCLNGVSAFPAPDEQQKVVAPAIKSARQTGSDEKAVSDALGIDAEEIRWVLRGEGIFRPRRLASHQKTTREWISQGKVGIRGAKVTILQIWYLQ